LGKQGLFQEIQLGPTALCARTLSLLTRHCDLECEAFVVVVGGPEVAHPVAASITSKLEYRKDAMTPPLIDLMACIAFNGPPMTPLWKYPTCG